jgi:hypothetical protein
MKLKTLASSPNWQGTLEHPEEWIELLSTISNGHPALILPSQVDPSLIHNIGKFKEWLSPQEHQWLSQFKEVRNLQPPTEVAFNWNYFKQFQLLSIHQSHIINVQQLIENGRKLHFMW